MMKRGRRKRDKRRSRWDRHVNRTFREMVIAITDEDFPLNLTLQTFVNAVLELPGHQESPVFPADFDDSPVWAVNGVGKLPTER